MGLLLAGCSWRTPKCDSVFSAEQAAELKEIINRNMTDADWEKLQQGYDRIAKIADYKHSIDIRRDFDKDPWVLIAFLENSGWNPKLQEELSVFIRKWMQERIIEESKKDTKVNEKEREETRKQVDAFLVSLRTK